MPQPTVRHLATALLDRSGPVAQPRHGVSPELVLFCPAFDDTLDGLNPDRLDVATLTIFTPGITEGGLPGGPPGDWSHWTLPFDAEQLPVASLDMQLAGRYALVLKTAKRHADVWRAVSADDSLERVLAAASSAPHPWTLDAVLDMHADAQPVAVRYAGWVADAA